MSSTDPSAHQYQGLTIGLFGHLAHAFCNRVFKDPAQHCEVDIVMSMAIALDNALAQRDEAIAALREAKNALEHCARNHESGLARLKLPIVDSALARLDDPKAEPSR